MPVTKCLQLYLASTLEELNKLAEVDQKISNARVYIKSADKVYKTADEFYGKGDEEKAYVLYMKYFNIISLVRKSAEYKKDQKYYAELIGHKACGTAIHRAEELSKSLKNRYDVLAEIQRESNDAPMVTLPSVPVSTRRDGDLPVHSRRDGDLPVHSKRDGDLTTHHVTDVKIESGDGRTPSPTEPENKVTKKEDVPPGAISARRVYELLRQEDTALLLIDLRPQIQFSQSHINHHSCINVPADIVPPGKLVKHFQASIPAESRALWDARSGVTHVVLFDWSSTIDTVKPGTPLSSLKDAIYKWDRGVLKNEPLVLDGGYEAWLFHYPTMTTNAHFKCQDTEPLPKAQHSSSLGFDYPDFDEAFSVPESRAPVLSVPVNNEIKAATVSDDSIHAAKTTRGDKNNDGVRANVYDETNLEKFLGHTRPTVDRTLKPRLSGSTHSTGNVHDDSELQLLRRQVAELRRLRETEQAELLSLHSENEAKIEAQEARLQKLVIEEQRLDSVQAKRAKGEKELADLMREQKRVREEIKREQRQLEDERIRQVKVESEKQSLLVKLDEEERQKVRQETSLYNGEHSSATINPVPPPGDQSRASVDRDLEPESRAQSEDSLRGDVADDTSAGPAVVVTANGSEAHQPAPPAGGALKGGVAHAGATTRPLAKEIRKSTKDFHLESTPARLSTGRSQNGSVPTKEPKPMQKGSVANDVALDEAPLRAAPKLLQFTDVGTSDRPSAKIDWSKIDSPRTQIRAQPADAGVGAIPVGWEKRYDKASDRYFYLDHSTKTTRWDPPSIVKSSMDTPGKKFTQLKEEPTAPSSGNLRRSSSTPNIARLADDAVAAPAIADKSAPGASVAPSLPRVDRALKPHAPDPRRQSLTEFTGQRLLTMQPQYGNVDRGLTGLRNLGNTCYMNSIIQALNNTTPLVTYFLNTDYISHINRNNFLGHNGEIPEELAVVVRALWSGKYTKFSPKDFKYIVGKHNPVFAGYGQQDSQEFLLFLLDGLHEDLNMVVDRPKIGHQDNDNLADAHAAQLAWQNHKLLNESIIVELFQGQYKSTLTCLECSKKSVTFDTFMYLSLPIPSSNRCTLQDCLRHFLKEEKIAGASKWFCPRCKQRREAHKKIDLWKLPAILLIHLKRFSCDGQFGQKLNTLVNFPLANLNMREYIKGTKMRPDYNLYAVSNHYGTMASGHYTAYCKNPVLKKWYKFDDADVYPLSEGDIRSSAAYILFYTSIDVSPTFL